MLGALRVMPALSGAWSPLDLPGLVGWWDASDTATITESGGAVSQWDDKSGNGYHAVQATAGAKPTTGTRTQNGLNVLDLDGGDRLVVNFGSTLTTERTIFVVGAFDDIVSANNVIFDSTTDQHAIYIQAGSLLTYFATSISRYFDGGDWDSSPDTNFHVLTVVAGSYGLTGFTFGDHRSGGWNLDGALAEVIVCSSALSDGDRATAKSALATKWGTP